MNACEIKKNTFIFKSILYSWPILVSIFQESESELQFAEDEELLDDRERIEKEHKKEKDKKAGTLSSLPEDNLFEKVMVCFLSSFILNI